ncbi:MAG TPA: DUF6159 family protein [Acidimicrobiales bacterium]
MAKNPNGRAVLNASFRLLRQDRQMIWLPVMATVTAVICFAVISGPIAFALRHSTFGVFLALLCGSVVASAATVIFNVALVFAATDRIEGRTPTVSGALAQAWGRKGIIFQWALLAAVVGTAIRLLEERLGLLGRILGFAGGLAWVVATYLVIPVLAFEDVGPIEAIKRSSSMFKNRFGTVARSGLRFGVLFGAASILAAIVLVVGIGLAAAGSATLVLGIVIAVLGFGALIGIAMYAGAAGIYMRTILYRFATDQPVPEIGVDMGSVFRSY